MADAVQTDLVADRRVDFIRTWAFDEDFTGSTFKMQIRATPDLTGTPLLEATSGSGSFSLPYIGTATVAAHIAAGRLSSDVYTQINPTTGINYVAGDNLLISQLGVGLAATGFLASFPFPEERGDDFQGWYDIIRTPASGPLNPELLMRGKFTVRAGVTIP
jgi:hypothetical protein